LEISKYSLAFELSLGLILLKHNIMAKKEKQDWKDRLNIVYSTNPDYSYQSESDEEAETLDPKKQNLRVSIDRKKRKGKSVTLIEGFVGTDNDLKELAKLLKTKCGVGGSAKDGEIIIQGEFKQKVAELLNTMGYKTKLIGG
jgi:translation initiation factor 1